MPSWSGGYVTDINYVASYHSEQTASHMSLAGLLCGFDTPDPTRPYLSVELGCGSGLGVVINAAANPHAHFVGMDFMPGHIARGRALAEAAGIDNVELHEASFEDWLEADCPVDPGSADYVIAHGIYSWVSDDNVRRVRQLMGRLVRPGGLAQLSYNCYPGWTMGMVLRRVVMAGADLTHGTSDQRAINGLELAQRVAEMTDSQALSPTLLERFGGHAKSKRGSYLAHELLNGAWHVRFSHDVIEEMQEVKLDFIAHAALIANLPELNHSKEMNAFLDALPPTTARFLLEDVAAGRGFRRDLYMKGAVAMPDTRKLNRLSDLRLMNAMAPASCALKLTVPEGTAELEESTYRPLLESMLDGPQPLRDLQALAAASGGTTTVERIASLMVGAGYCLLDAGITADRARVQRTALALIKWLELEPVLVAMAVPAARGGGAIPIDAFDQLGLAALLLGAPAEPEALTRAAYQVLVERGESLVREGKELEGEQAHLDLLRPVMTRIVEREIPVWRAAGIVD